MMDGWMDEWKGTNFNFKALLYFEMKCIYVCVYLCMYVLSHSVISDSWTVAHQDTLWDFLGKNTEVGAVSFSRGSSQPRDQTRICCTSCIGRQIPHH